MATNQASEQRQHARAAVSLMGSMLDPEGQSQPIVILDLSAAGALVQTHEPPRDSGQYQLQFSVHRPAYDVPIDVVGSLQIKDAWGWRCRFLEVTPAEEQALERALLAALGARTHVMRPWAELQPRATAAPGDLLVIGETPAGHDISVGGKDLLEMGPEGTELYVQMIAELERM